MSHPGNRHRSPRKLALERTRQWSAQELPPGWVSIGGQPTAERTASACKVRGAVVEGRCRLGAECFRKVRIDLDFLIAHGFGGVELSRLEPAYRCGRLGGCELSFGEISYPDGGCLFGMVLEKAILTVRFHCAGCEREGYSASPATLIRMLKERGRGDGNTGILAVVRMLRLRCACGSTEWRHQIERERAAGSG